VTLRSGIAARIARYNKGRAPDLLARKYALMAASPFAFYRGSCELFFDTWPKRSPLDHTPPVWACGDLHFENFGSYKGDNRLVYFDLNDFDEAALLPFGWELTRFVGSVLVGASAIGAKKSDAMALARCYLDAFAEALASGKARWLERETASGMARELLDAVRLRKRKKLIAKRTEMRGGRRRLVIDGEKTLAATKSEAKRARAIVAKIAKSDAHREFFTVLDVARRIAGTGSLGLDRWVVLVEGNGGPAGHYLIDVKEARPSAPAAHSRYRQPRWASDAARIVAVQQRVQAVMPALLHAVTNGGSSFVVRELQPSQDRLRLESANADVARLREAMTAMAQLTAWGALRAGGRQGSATIDELLAFAAERRWKAEVLDTARRVAAQTLMDWKEFRAGR
jgi:uncharacterized protein (DUF2252 family)